jgi:SAM-dependent methyltransferase
MARSEWFADWFDSPYYPILYNYRDEAEAEQFVRNLVRHLQPEPGSKILDLACGSGRHAIQLAAMGFQPVGLDLSPESIERAKAAAPPNASFQVADMRSFELPQRFDLILNLFTSFGYFDSEADNLRVMQRIRSHLVHDGRVVIDFLNAEKAISGLKPEEFVQRGEVQFHLRRAVEHGRVIKRIQVTDGDMHYEFQESVQLLTRDDFRQLAEQTGFTIVETWGDYEGHPFDAAESPRLILFLRPA